jgi:hypothetical protein
VYFSLALEPDRAGQSDDQPGYNARFHRSATRPHLRALLREPLAFLSASMLSLTAVWLWWIVLP